MDYYDVGRTALLNPGLSPESVYSRSLESSGVERNGVKISGRRDESDGLRPQGFNQPNAGRLVRRLVALSFRSVVEHGLRSRMVGERQKGGDGGRKRRRKRGR